MMMIRDRLWWLLMMMMMMMIIPTMLLLMSDGNDNTCLYHIHTHTPQRVHYSRILDHQVFICFYAMCELTTVTRTKGETLPYGIEQVIHKDIDMYSSSHSCRYSVDMICIRHKGKGTRLRYYVCFIMAMIGDDGWWSDDLWFRVMIL